VISAERSIFLFLATSLLLKILPLPVLNLLSWVETGDRTMITHYSSPDFATSSFGVFKFFHLQYASGLGCEVDLVGFLAWSDDNQYNENQ
jgi:hypothetical protein